ncbi:MAG: 4-hydroxy-tetrahydrodipicolinate synthase [Clostridiales bacterium]|jgi:4-hydroxy-tetrahydrodipicolinate synthase|nr:4-hydroxy-tetrahydrodipicolinate synthase [Clostridiales bacterium]
MGTDHTTLFKGCGTAIITPFSASKTLDFNVLEGLIEFQISNGTDALIVLGTTGEATTMTREEKSAAIKFTVEKVRGRIPVIAGTGSNCTETAAKNSIEAESLGADGLLVVTPYYNKCTQNGLVAHYGAIAERVKIPIIAYNVPCRTCVNLLPATFARIAEQYKNVVAVKEASGNLEQIAEVIRLTRGKAVVYSGDDSLAVPVIKLGGAGLISVASNIAPKYFSDMTRLALNGKTEQAAALQEKIQPLIKALFSEVNPIPVKAASKLLGLSDGSLRLPLTEIEDEHFVLLEKTLKEFGLIN